MKIISKVGHLLYIILKMKTCNLNYNYKSMKNLKEGNKSKTFHPQNK